MNKDAINEYINYFSDPLSDEKLNELNALNKIISERVGLYSDFIISLAHIINDTYLGDDITNQEEQVLHFNWCWNKNITNFKLEDFNFKQNGDHYYFFLDYFGAIFYETPDKNAKLLNKITYFWGDIFSEERALTKSEYHVFLTAYNILNDYFKK